MQQITGSDRIQAVRWFHAVCAAIAARLPFGLERWIPATFVGYLLVSAAMFGVDLLVLTVLHGTFGAGLGIAVTVGYVTAFGASYVLNRVLNFSSHAPVGPQVARYIVVVVINYLVFILGATTWLSALGLEYHLARTLAGLGEALYMYAALRWLVFRDLTTRDR
ncbi:GtrA family protein [Nocardia huaxiensis]|uniref:GtrA family protein n=1 Tax=Nocardia huaxiensis TaxID=2755382 RepID=A0A7D6ZHN5_9NOCA|nr:GtrA family protein [Nocardia huaxiensis]QLY33838.1 GtrA family protein [Nocardia huaxiensis]